MESKKCTKFLLVLLMTLFTGSALAQQKTFTGVVKDESGSPLIGVSVSLQGTEQATTTDVNGKFSLQAASGGTLVFTYVGYTTQTRTLGTDTALEVLMQSSAQALGDVVVTALGIKREKKSLGYAVQEVKGEALVEAREPNLVNSLSGKVAGLQVTRSGNGPAGSSKITLRGNNSLTGSNQPLIVVDGVPVNNFTGMDNNDYWNPTLDMGNGLSDINADDIESISVLKGPSAAALYGSRAGNGAILITTKTGKARKGLGITFSSSLGIESLFARPDMQQSFGQGVDGVYDVESASSWGPKADGQMVTGWDGSQMPLRIYDNVGNYLNQGIRSDQSLSFQQQFDATSVYTSFNRLDDKSLIPGAKLTRTNLLARTITHLGDSDRWTIDTKVQYINSNAQNRPQGGPRNDNTFYALYLLPRSVDITQFEAGKDADGNMIWYEGGQQINPYWARNNNLNQDIRDRYLMNGSLAYAFTDWLTAEVKAGVDMYTVNTEAKTYGGSPMTPTGRYSKGKETFSEANYSTLITARKDALFGKFGGALTLGGNLMSQKHSGLSSSVSELEVPDLFSLNNGQSNPSVTESYSHRRINSVYGTAELNYDGYLFLNGTFRNDWSSTLSPENRSFFYPSVSASFVFSDMITKQGGKLPSWMSYGKLRASYASVGNDLSPYQLYNTYSIGKDPNGNTTGSSKPVLYNPDVRSELIKSYEAGLEMRFLENRIGFDVALYKSNATRQLIDLPMDPLSGYSSRKINAGDIENKGIEVMLDGQLLQNREGLNWNLMVNFSRNVNTVNALAEGVERYELGGFDNVKILAIEGARYGEIYGSRFLRVTDPESEFFGDLLLDAEGRPQEGEQGVRLGNQQASGLLGITNMFQYKGFGLAFLVDARLGGKIFSGTLADMQANGTAAMTAPAGQREAFLVEGAVYDEASESYKANTTTVSPQRYWAAVAGVGNMGITEANLYDASSVRLRNLQISYTLPDRFIAGTAIKRAKIGVTCNNVWLISSHMHGLDPESVYATGTNAIGFENGSAPTTRTFLFNLTVDF